MQISSALAGYSPGQGRPASPRDGQEEGGGHGQGEGRLPRRRQGRRRSTRKIAERVFDLMEKFAGYGFNRSHSAAYGLLTYQTAYLKRYFPVEFFAALLTCDKDDTDAVVKFIAEARANGIAVLRPDINESDTDFSVVKVEAEGKADDLSNVNNATRARNGEKAAAKKVIRFGLGAVKGVGEGAVEVIKVARDQGGAVPVAVRLLQARRRAQGEPQGASRRWSRRARSTASPRRTASRAPGCSARSRVGVRARGRGPARARERPDQPAGAVRRAPAATIGPAPAAGEDKYPTPRSGCPRSCSPSRRRASASTSAATRSIATPARSAASPTATCANCMEKGERAEVILGGRGQRLPGAPDEERAGQDRLLQPRGSDRADRVLRELARSWRSTARSCRATSRCW